MSGRRLACVLVAAFGCVHRKAPEGPPPLAIIYTGGLHGAVAALSKEPGGLARRATLVDRARLQAGTVVQVDAGDIAPSAEDDPSFPDSAARANRTALILQAYRRMGVDAVTVGERDLALGASALRNLCDEAKIPVVAANLWNGAGQRLFPADRVLQAGDVTVGVFGILDLGGTAGAAPAGVTVSDAAAAARAAVTSLRARGARLVVGLFHVAGGQARARELAAVATGVDLIVLGHDGPGASPQIVWTGTGGGAVGRVDVRVPERGPPHFEDRLFATTPDVPEQLGVHLLVRVGTGGHIAETFEESVTAMQKAAGHRLFGEGWTYGSTALCEGCHATQAAQWRTTDHAHAMATLKAKAHDRQPGCMGCHMTGFLMAGGPQNFETATTQFTDVGCEACHGPSVAHVMSQNKHKGTSRRVDPEVCLGCHTPDQNIGTFSVAEAMKEVIGPGHGLPPTGPKP